jgi:parallel beta-helix repeat protein
MTPRKRLMFLLVVVGLVAHVSTAQDALAQRTTYVQDDLQAAIDQATSGDTLIIGKGIYEAVATGFEEPICGNCVEPLTTVKATAGFHIKDKSLTLIGESRDSTILVTNAGYGIFFEGSFGSTVTNLTITGGIRDPDGNATDAAIVAKNSRVTIHAVSIVDNTNRIESIAVGIGGVFGREGSELIILNNLIRNNGWDGVALYRGSTAVIADNKIEEGRGAGIGITWDSNALVYRNRITGYWKGIGAFGDTWVSARNNAVYDNLAWGVVATGRAYMEVSNNVIHHNGDCGFAIWQDTANGILSNNIITENGWRKKHICPGVGLWANEGPGQFRIISNNLWNNVAGDYQGLEDQTGINGNISSDPLFEPDGSFGLRVGSPCIDAGDSLLIDRDGTRSDIGLHGGPQARHKSN